MFILSYFTGEHAIFSSKNDMGNSEQETDVNCLCLYNDTCMYVIICFFFKVKFWEKVVLTYSINWRWMLFHELDTVKKYFRSLTITSMCSSIYYCWLKRTRFIFIIINSIYKLYILIYLKYHSWITHKAYFKTSMYTLNIIAELH